MIKDTGDRLEKAIQELRTFIVGLPFHYTKSMPPIRIIEQHRIPPSPDQSYPKTRSSWRPRKNSQKQPRKSSVRYMTEEALFNSYQGVAGQQSALRSRLKLYARTLDETYVELVLDVAPSVPHIRKIHGCCCRIIFITAAPPHSKLFPCVHI